MTDSAPPIDDMRENGEEEAKAHFLRNIGQMAGSAILMQEHRDGRLESVFASEGFAGMMGCTQGEALQRMDGMGFFRTIHPEDRPFVRAMLKRHVTETGGSELTLRMLTASGKMLWCRVQYSFIDDFGGHYIYCVYTDVTVLKAYEERLRSVYASLGSNFYKPNERTLALFRVNLTRNAIEEAKGRDLYPADSPKYPYSEALARRAENYLIASERERFLRTFAWESLSDGYEEGRVTVSAVLYSRRADGRLCYVDFTATLTRHPLSGDVIAFITERECNDEKVRETLMTRILVRQFDMVAYLVEGRYGVTIGDAGRIKKGGIFPASRSGEYRQYLCDQVLPVLSGNDEYRADAAKALSLETIRERTRQSQPYVVNITIAIDGEIYHKRFDFYSADPEADFYIVLKSDVTEVHREQEARNEQLRAALYEAQQANVAKTAFLSSMSHEIRTPMNAIIGLDNIALNDPEISERTRDRLEKIGGSARHLLGLINDILDMSRIESGRAALKNEEFSFRSMLEQINTMIAGQLQDRGLQYECRVIGPLSEYYIGDDMKLKQVLINILGNAMKFTPAPGTVTFLIEETARFGEQSTLRFIIRDTGIGMDEAYLPRLFDAFTQEDVTTTNKYGGSGLGMAITKNIVEMMNGNISVESEKGVGSTFTVNVTLRNSDRSETGGAVIHPEDMDTLVIDDDPVACEHARLALAGAGVTADTALSGAAAIEMVSLRHARREDYNLILVDLKMPEMDGIAVTRRIRRIIGGGAAVILLTAGTWSDVEEEAVRAGVDSFMSKPLFPANILYEFGQILDRKRLKPDEGGEAADLTGRRILVAEDMLINAEILRELLEMMEMAVEHAENGRIAVEMFSGSPEGHFDAVLMDMRMPEMDGLTAARTIRALDRPDARTVPIIALTANAFDEDVQRSLQAGMNAHLSKPVEPDRLYETLDSLIRG